MRRINRSGLSLAVGLMLLSGASHAARFVYEGRLDDAGRPAEGRYDLQLTAYGDAALGSTLAAPIDFENVEVRAGRFRVEVDLPWVQAEQVWLEVAVRGSGEPQYSAIPGRTRAIAAPLVGACWSTTGDAGSDPATNFLGTTDAQPLVLRTQNVPSLRIAPSAELFAGIPITTNTVAGSSANEVTAGVRGATIAGGGVPTGFSDPNFGLENPNRVNDHYGTVGGGYANRAGNEAGGDLNGESFATVGGGLNNAASGFASVIGGGAQNATSEFGSTVGGGEGNSASGNASVIAGGSNNRASGQNSVVGGGASNRADGVASTVAGGDRSQALGRASTVSGGDRNCAGGVYSWAGGRNARVRPPADPGPTICGGLLSYPGGDGDSGTFVWADGQASNFVSTGSNQFLVRAQGGAAINSNDPAGNALRVNGTLRVDTLGTAAATTLCRNANNQIASCSSSARYKRDIADLDLGLATALRLHAVGYRWKDTGEADVGFVAEEVATVDERLVTRNATGTIEGVKYDRVAAVLANAVQELAARDSLANDTLHRLESENARLREAQATLAAELAALRALIVDRKAR